MLKVDDISVSYGPIQILSNISLDVGDKEILAVIGPNGHGKSTLLRSVAGLNPPTSGEIWLNGARIDNLPMHEIVRRGIVLMPEGGGYLPYFTVYDNLRLGAYSNRKGLHRKLEEVNALFPWLRERSRQIAWTLSGGERKMLGIARSLMIDSSFLLLDEPTWGVAPRVANDLIEIIQNIRDTGRGIVIAESNVEFVAKLAERTVELKNNAITAIDRSLLGEKRVERLA